MFPKAKLRGGSRGNKTHCFSRGQPLSVLFTSRLKKKKKILQKNDLLNTTVAVSAVRAAVKPSCPTETTQ